MLFLPVFVGVWSFSFGSFLICLLCSSSHGLGSVDQGKYLSGLSPDLAGLDAQSLTWLGAFLRSLRDTRFSVWLQRLFFCAMLVWVLGVYLAYAITQPLE